MKITGALTVLATLAVGVHGACEATTEFMLGSVTKLAFQGFTPSIQRCVFQRSCFRTPYLFLHSPWTSFVVVVWQ